MNNISSIISKLRAIKIEKKVVLGWIISLVLIIVLNAILYISKLETHKTSDLIARTSDLRVASNNVIEIIQKLELNSKRFILTGSKDDSDEYYENLNKLNDAVINLSGLLKDQPAILKYLLPLKTTIEQELSNFKSLTSTKNNPNLDNKLLLAEINIYKKLSNNWNTLNNKIEELTITYVQDLDIKMSQNLIAFYITILVYIILMSLLFWLIIIEVKRRRKLGEEIARNRSELFAIINTAPALIFVKDKDKKFRLVNDQFCKFFNTKSKDVLNVDNNKLISVEDKWLADEEDSVILNDKLPLSNIEREVKLSDNSKRWLKINKAPLLDENNIAIGIVGIMDDITERVNYQEELLKTKRELEKLNSQKNKLFSIIAHDLRSPFTGLLGFSDILKEDYNNLSEQERMYYVEGIDTSLKNTLSFIDNLLAWTRLNMDRIDFNPTETLLSIVINSAIKSQKVNAKNKQIELHTVYDENLKIYADAGMIETVIRNLVSNAIKFTPKGGKVKLNAALEDDNIRISIEDNGVGMSTETAKILFDNTPKVSTKGTDNEKGTGLGLTICKEFIDKHKGKIFVESELNKGTIISFLLPEQKIYNQPTPEHCDDMSN